jgi:hypothetical protein
MKIICLIKNITDNCMYWMISIFQLLHQMLSLKSIKKKSNIIRYLNEAL